MSSFCKNQTTGKLLIPRTTPKNVISSADFRYLTAVRKAQVVCWQCRMERPLSCNKVRSKDGYFPFRMCPRMVGPSGPATCTWTPLVAITCEVFGVSLSGYRHYANWKHKFVNAGANFQCGTGQL